MHIDPCQMQTEPDTGGTDATVTVLVTWNPKLTACTGCTVAV
jgi:hypothetical protein